MSGPDRLRHRTAAAAPSSPRPPPSSGGGRGDRLLLLPGQSPPPSPRRRAAVRHKMDRHDDEAAPSTSRDVEEGYELSSLMSHGSGGDGSAGGSGVPSQQHGRKTHRHQHHYGKVSGGTSVESGRPSSPTHKPHHSHPHCRPRSADDTKNTPSGDVRSRTLFLKTAFWIACWYGTSLATLFLNKIILSREGSSVHVLGMCQMTAAAVLGGWSAFGGAEKVQNAANGMLAFAARRMPGGARRRLGLGSPGATAGGPTHGRDDGEGPAKSPASHSAPDRSSGRPSTPSKSPDRYSFHFVRDMSVVGLLRGLTVVLGLVALEHVPVSFVETVKATAPAFTVVFARIILQERTAFPVTLSLIPVVAGLVLCSASELRFDAVGFTAALLNNCADCVQNVMSKRMLAHLRPTQLQFYTSVAALALQAPFVMRDVSGLVRGWAAHKDAADMDVLPEEAAESADEGMSLTKLLIIDAIFYHLQSVSAYCTMGCMSPVSQSVANTLKRALLVWASILYFGNPVTNAGIVGIAMVVSGVFLYNHVRRIYQS
ncbi:hypothetical protein ACHAWF_006750 [Thalassiosira exigua]